MAACLRAAQSAAPCSALSPVPLLPACCSGWSAPVCCGDALWKTASQRHTPCLGSLGKAWPMTHQPRWMEGNSLLARPDSAFNDSCHFLAVTAARSFHAPTPLISACCKHSVLMTFCLPAQTHGRTITCVWYAALFAAPAYCSDHRAQLCKLHCE